MPKQFPIQPSLEHFRKQAKQLLRDIRSGVTEAIARAHRSHPRWANTTDLSRAFSLHDAQLVVAREFGFASWRRLQDAATREQDSSGLRRHALVTGGAGFIGSHLAEGLLARGHHVTALDDLSAGSRHNVAHLLDDPHLDLIVGDICDADLVDRLVAGVDVVFHLAAVVGSPAQAVDPLTLWRTNIDGTEVVIDAASRHDVRFLLASTSMVYGKTEGRETLKEDADLILGPGDTKGWDYALSKVANELLTRAHSERHHLRATVVRLFNVVGPRSRGSVVPNFVDQARAHRPLSVHGDGTHRRCFTDVRDVIAGFVRLAGCDDACGHAVNIGSRKELNLLQLASMVKAITRSTSPVEHIPYENVPFGEIQRHIPWKTPCLAKARQLIGYAASHPIEECLHEIVALGESRSAHDALE